MVSDRLLLAVSRQQLERMRADLFAVVESIVSEASGSVVDVGSILVRHRL
jgi:hypothetical protein